MDDKGSDRIIDEVFKRKKLTRSIIFKKKKEQTKKKFKLKIKKIDDKYINKYLYVSNNSINRKNSLTRKKLIRSIIIFGGSKIIENHLFLQKTMKK